MTTNTPAETPQVANILWTESEERRMNSRDVESGVTSPSDIFLANSIDALGLLQHNSSMLSIGPGRGDIELELADKYDLSLSIVEPSLEYYAQLLQRGKQKGITFNSDSSFNGTLQSYSNNTAKYQTLLCVNSWYYVGLDHQCLNKAIRLLKPNGHLIIVLVSETSPGFQIQKRIREKDRQYISAEQLVQDSHSHGLTTVFHKWTNSMPLERFFVDGEMTSFGDKWLSFVTGKEHLSEADLSTVHTILKEDKTEELSYTYGCLIFRA